ncbi:DUF7935 family protein [Williamwhitmania taraxaci]|uniref:Uncharacterized protein n=1 Tax=Williamwhitmania taraxaci TaxID=1640674 RepID=A0A1G6QPJ4_9BACT|nr:hypothetical protein [Williamwhitmania taraxaci]SDC93605.1 hypothetical protein SAMN05216323_106317 [Williamwhitmania taraxaci]
MDPLYTLLLVAIPAIIVYLSSYLSFKKIIESEHNRHKQEILLNNQKLIVPIRLRAYERLILFLERVSPENLIVRIHRPEMKAKELEKALMDTIRAEFDHNLSQQLYVSAQAWEAVKSARANLLNIISTAMDEISPESPGIILSRKILVKLVEHEVNPVSPAIDYLKSEVNQLF